MLPGLGRYRRSLCGLFFLIFGVVARPVPIDMDAEVSRVGLLGVASYFLFWLSGIEAIGALVRRKIPAMPPGWVLSCGIGSVLAGGWVALLGHSGGLGPERAWLFTAILLVCLVLADAGEARTRCASARLRLVVPKLAPLDVFVGTVRLLVLALFAKQVAMALVPQSHSDPLIFDLFGTRSWYQLGAIEVLPRHPGGMRALFWDYLFVWGHELLGGTGSAGLLDAAVFGQLVHCVLGMGGTLLVLYRLLVTIGVGEPARSVALLLGAGCPWLLWTSFEAKVDWGVVFWTFCGAYVLISQDPMRARFRAGIGGAFMGAAFAAKFSAAIFILPFLLFWIAERWRLKGKRAALSSAAWIAATAGLLSAVILWRNWTLLGAPFFPVPSRHFPSPWFSELMNRSLLQLGGMPGASVLPAVARRAETLWHEHPVQLLGIALGLLSLAVSRGRPERRILSTGGISVGAALLAIGGRPGNVDDGNLYLRLAGPALILSPAFAVAILDDWLRARNAWRGIALALLGLLGAWPLVDNLRRFSPERYWELAGQVPIALRQLTLGGDSKTWLRLNVGERELILTTGDSQLYYNVHQRISPVNEQPWLSAELRRVLEVPRTDEQALIESLRVLTGTGARYLLDTRHFELRHWSALSALIDQQIGRAAGAVVFQGRESRVVDMRGMLDVLSGACVSPLVPTDPMAALL